MFRDWMYLSIAIALTMMVVCPASAQQRSRGGMRPGNVAPARLLVVQAVQAELKLTDDQKKKAAELNETLSKARRELFQKVAKDSHERSEKVAELDKKTDASIEELLDANQEKRLNELLLQVNGASELLKPNVAEALQITKEQHKKLTEANRANAKAKKDALENFDGDRQAKTLELQREGDKKLLIVLTEEQKKKFEEMQGEKISIKLFGSESN
jgi:hypothetical protein